MKALKILLLSFIIVIFGCASVNKNTLPEDQGVGYSWWKEAPTWMAKDFISDGYGLIDGFRFEFRMADAWGVKVDNPTSDPEGLDGQCDDVVIVVDTGQTAARSGGYEGPLVQVLGSFQCEQWDEIRKDLLKITEAQK